MPRLHRSLLAGLFAAGLLLGAAPAADAAIALDGSAQGSVSNAASGTVVLTTTNASDAVMLIVAIENPTNARSVTSVTDVVGITFTRRASYTVTGSPAGNGVLVVEEWCAPASGTLAAAVITANFSAATDGGALVAFGVSGTNSGCSFDSNGSVPAAVSNSTGFSNPGTQITFSTSQAHSMAIQAGFVPTSGDQTSGTWTVIQDVKNNTPPALWAYLGVYYKIYSTTQSNTTTDYTGASGGYPSIRMVDALTADASSPAGVSNGALSLTGVGR